MTNFSSLPCRARLVTIQVMAQIPQRFVTLTIFAIFLSVAQLTALPAKGKAMSRGAVLSRQPAKFVSGSPVLFEVAAPSNVQSISATWMGHQISFFRAAKTKSWYSLAGIPVETSPGIDTIVLTETLSDGKTKQISQKIKIGIANYPKITITVAKKFTEPNTQQVKEINTDKDLKKKVLATETPDRLWAGNFAPPVSAAISDVFGTARVINQEVKSRHLGLDFGVTTGTEVHAINSGTVILARPLYFEGSCVVIDHGQGLLSLYLHLSEFRVKEGDQVETGQLIGLSGGSGRATGPHLHLAIRWQGVYLNPAVLLQLKTP